MSTARVPLGPASSAFREWLATPLEIVRDEQIPRRARGHLLRALAKELVEMAVRLDVEAEVAERGGVKGGDA